MSGGALPSMLMGVAVPLSWPVEWGGWVGGWVGWIKWVGGWVSGWDVYLHGCVGERCGG